MRKASASERSAQRVRVAAIALSVAGGFGLAVGAASRADADPVSDDGSAGDGGLHLSPDVITNEGLRSGVSADFPIATRLFLPQMDDRARQTKQSAAAVTRAAEKLTFAPAQSASTADAVAKTRGRLFRDYSHQPTPGADRSEPAHAADVWMSVVIGVGVPLTGLAAFVGLRSASRRASRHA